MELFLSLGVKTVRGLSSTGATAVLGIGCFLAAVKTMVHPILHGNPEPSLIRSCALSNYTNIVGLSQEGVETRRLPPNVASDYGEGIVRGVGKPTQT